MLTRTETIDALVAAGAGKFNRVGQRQGGFCYLNQITYTVIHENRPYSVFIDKNDYGVMEKVLGTDVMDALFYYNALAWKEEIG